MDVDYPAAHSMCTRWFAVDPDGHVGYFYSGDSGAAPRDVPPESHSFAGWCAVVECLAEVLPHGEALEDVRGRCCVFREKPPHCPYALPEHPLLMFLHSADAIRDEIEAGRAVPVGAVEGVAFVLIGTSTEVYERVHQANACRACFWHFLRATDAALSMAELGMFCFEHTMGNGLSYPYERQTVPAQPLHVDQLPPENRRIVRRLALPLRFPDTLVIQPVEHLSCESLEPAYLDSTGTKLKPIPGKEQDYVAFYEELESWNKNRYAMDPPPQRSG